LKTFVGLSKRKFISILNDREYVSDWNFQGLRCKNHSLCLIGDHIGLTYIESKRILIEIKRHNYIFYKIVDVPNYNELVPLFNSFKVICQIGEEYYLVKDNFNKYKMEIGQKPLSDYLFKKLSKLSGYKLIKRLK
jgi:hypothetical protein